MDKSFTKMKVRSAKRPVTRNSLSVILVASEKNIIWSDFWPALFARNGKSNGSARRAEKTSVRSVAGRSVK